MSIEMPRNIWKIFPAAAVALVFVAHVSAQQSLPADTTASTTSSTDLLQPVSKTWKDKMLEKQLRSGATKSFGFEPGSLTGVAVAPAPSSRNTESPAAKRRREQLEQMRYLMIMNADDPSKGSTLDDLLNLQGLDADKQTSGSPLGKLYLKQLQNERSAATNRAKAELDYRNDSNPLLASGSENRNGAAQANSFLKNSTDPRSAAPSSASLFPDLFNPPASSPSQARFQQAHVNEFRQMLDARSPGSSPSASLGGNSGPSPSGFGKMLNSFSTPAANPGLRPSAAATPALSPQPTAQPSAYQPSQPQAKEPLPGYVPPRRRF